LWGSIHGAPTPVGWDAWFDTNKEGQFAARRAGVVDAEFSSTRLEDVCLCGSQAKATYSSGVIENAGMDRLPSKVRDDVEVLQTYTRANAFGFSVPYLPDGMPAADRSIRIGESLTKPLDFAKAHPLRLRLSRDRAARWGLFSVPDTVPDARARVKRPIRSHREYQDATVMGDKASNGQLIARDRHAAHLHGNFNHPAEPYRF
jgi:hypothetical protein